MKYFDKIYVQLQSCIQLFNLLEVSKKSTKIVLFLWNSLLIKITVENFGLPVKYRQI